MQILSTRDVWQCLETFLVVTTVVHRHGDLGELLLPTGQRPGMLINILNTQEGLPHNKELSYPKS